MVFSGGKVTCPVDDPMMLEGSNIALRSLPPEYFMQNNGITLFIAGKIGNKGPGAGCDGPIAKIARDFSVHFEDELPVTILDFKAGLEDSVRGVITSLDWAIVVVDPTIASIEMASDMKNMVARIKAGELPATEHLESKDLVSAANQLFNKARVKGVLTVMNKVENQDIENYMQSELLKVGVEPICTIPFDQLISQSCLKGKPLDSMICRTELGKIIKKLESLERFEEEVRIGQDFEDA
jgi:CO dehydrogenase nickel-insertion accessory protein CooC1